VDILHLFAWAAALLQSIGSVRCKRVHKMVVYFSGIIKRSPVTLDDGLVQFYCRDQKMPTYTYETIPNDSSDAPRRFEITQRMSDPTLTEDPASGQPVRKIITGGMGIKLGVLRRSTVVDKKSPAATACACTSGKRHQHT